MKRGFLWFLLFAAVLFTGCGMHLPPPKAENLLSYQTKPFSCTFTVWERGMIPFTVRMDREEDGDRLAVSGDTGETVFRRTAGAWYIDCAETEIPVTLPCEGGVSLWQSLFSLGLTGDVTYAEDGILYTDGKTEIFFSSDRVPHRFTYHGDGGDTELTVTDFYMK